MLISRWIDTQFPSAQTSNVLYERRIHIHKSPLNKCGFGFAVVDEALAGGMPNQEGRWDEAFASQMMFAYASS
jgi:hypothetical protein